LLAALAELGISPHNAIGIGDAENDHALLAACEIGVATGNALPVSKDRADLVLQGRNGAGVVEFLERLLASDLAEYDSRLMRHSILLGTALIDSAQEIRVPPGRNSVLVSGPSAAENRPL
jgi:cation transport ATPase